jgi:hypothetical protein
MITFASLNILPNHLHIQLVISSIHLRHSSFVELLLNGLNYSLVCIIYNRIF